MRARSRSTPRSKRRRRSRPTAGSSDWSRARISARSRPCSPRCGAWSMRAPKRRKQDTDSRRSWPNPTERGGERCRCGGSAGKPAEALAALSRRLEAVLEDAPDWLDAQARARVEGAIRGLSWRRETVVAWLALLGRIGGEGDPEFVDWLAVDRFDGREFDVAIHRRWLDPTKPLAGPCSRPRTACS